jgi:hypothetical protein
MDRPHTLRASGSENDAGVERSALKAPMKVMALLGCRRAV